MSPGHAPIPTSPLRLQVARWSRPLRVPVVVGTAPPQSTREGLLVALGAEGREGIGDAAPLPGLSHETLDEVVMAARALADRAPVTIADLAQLELQLPSLGFALQSAALDLLGVAPSALRTARLLTDDLHEDRHVSGVVKVKVGRADLDVECEDVRRLAARGLRLRLDGNRRLDVDGTRALAAAAGDALEFFEEPTPRALLAALDVPLALDESLDEALGALPAGATAAQLHEVLRALPPAKVWVVKPTILGPARVARLLASAPGSDVGIVFSSAYDSAVGRRGLVRLGAQRGLWGAVHGLGTDDLLAPDLVSSAGPILLRDGDAVGIGAPLTTASFPGLSWETVW
jgi:O-succinylbenzoate synthase